MTRERALAGAVFVLILFQHFQLIALAGYPVTVGLLVGGVAVLAVTRKRLAVTVPIVVLVGGYVALVALISPVVVDGQQYARTLTLVLVSCIVIGLSVAPSGHNFVPGTAVRRAMLVALYLVVGMSLLQVISGYAGSEAFFNPFGAQQYLYEYRPNVGSVVFPRAQGFFLEPSYDAFVIGTVAATLFVLKYHRGQVALLAVAGLVASQSATGLLVLIAILLVATAQARPGIAIVAVCVLVVVLAVVGGTLGGRLNSIFNSASSANYRLIAPLQALGDTLTQSPLGRPLGSISQILKTYDLRNGTTVGSSLDNGFYVVVFYFGWVGLLALLILGLWMLRAIRRAFQRRSQAWIGPVWLVASLSFSGGIILPEYALMMWLLISAYRVAASEKGNARHASTQHHNRHLPRSAGPYKNPEVAPSPR